MEAALLMLREIVSSQSMPVLDVSPQGGLGNRLFTLHFASQAATRFNADLRTSQFSREQEWMRFPPAVLERPRWSPILHVRQFKRPRTSSLDVVAEVGKRLAQGKSVRLSKPLLGEVFFDSCFQPPIEIFPDCPKPTVKVDVAAHFRGGDFHDWNPASILPASYYIDAYKWVAEVLGRDPEVAIVSDDWDHPSLPGFQRFLEREGLKEPFLSRGTTIIQDFKTLMGARYLISCPSTFGIWAGILGDSLIVHSRRWVEQRVEAGDKFWCDLYCGGNEHYHCVQLV